VQDESRAWCRACQCALSASVVHLQRHAMSFRHVRCMQPLDDNGTEAVFLTKNNGMFNDITAYVSRCVLMLAVDHVTTMCVLFLVGYLQPTKSFICYGTDRPFCVGLQ